MVIFWRLNNMENNNTNPNQEDLINLPFYLKNEIFNLTFSIFGLGFMGLVAEYTKDWFAIAGAGMAFGFIIVQINLIARILLKKYY